MTFTKTLASIALLAVLAAIGIALASAPLHRAYTAEECFAAYARAESHTDTVHVDLRRYLPTSGAGANRRCGEVRAVVADSVSVIAIRGAR